ncbi:histidine kinase [Duganella sp. Leaf126]|uniref:ATP-binding protein n=1 Tax=Duganella sp. Leaf126 TaxID=1736266 RepID=UPI0006FB6936|nr:ATP-binding protein [Duganella sp. Leaf126]KQQ45887.1 histidine kinase [Duganella sp. Leaf126]
MTSTPDATVPHTILVATSSAYDHAALARALARHGYLVRAVSRGDEALAVARSGALTLAVVDVALAGSASLELCQRVRALCEPEVPLYLLSAAPHPEEQARALAIGAAEYLPLAMDPDELAGNILLRLGAILPAPNPRALPTMATLEVNYHTMLSGAPDTILLMQRGSNLLLDVNRRARQQFGLTEAELVRSDLPSLCPPRQPDGRPSVDVFAEQVAAVMGGATEMVALTMQHSSGRLLDCELRMVPINTGEHRLMHVQVVDVTARNRAAALRDGQNKLLEMIAGSAPLDQTLDRLTGLIEAQSQDVLCTVMLLGADGHTVAAASGAAMPRAYLDALVGLPIGPAAGSCGTAMHRGATVIVTDIEHDPLWAPYRAVAAQYGLRACWSIPIMQDSSTVIGSFAMYYRSVRAPDAQELALIGTASHLAGIAITRTRRDGELLRHREHLEELVTERTRQLRQAKEQAEQVNEELTTALEHLSMTQDELVRRDKLAALGALVAGVAHELNTPIGNSLVMASTMSERTVELRRELDSGLRRSVLESYLDQAASADQVVLRNLNRAAALVASFRHIAVDGANSPRSRFVLGEQVGQLLHAMEADLRRQGVTVAHAIDPTIELDSYSAPLLQALQHLVDNAVVHGFGSDHHGNAGLLRVTAHDSGTGDGVVVITVADNGAGIPGANLPRIYDPFFTTRMGAGGSGLGLYITHNIVTGVLGGHIDVASKVGHGTRVTLRLPKAAPL